ncbi:YwqG family protein [Halobacillus yeomjeoni]|uniref:DUF1963 domain-containing protein n=1 Tax=Halobacillus yeomjeoni TaxID=311194 RepID=A0A931HTY4_9BACI|nr:YwqG family protein [Halobacillus yeomjeoni]MBH0229742.1 DUF1963 domain-containing protein [Halobacillus yeomjeoni]
MKDNTPVLYIPKELKDYRTQIASTTEPFIKITTEKRNSTLDGSKFGGEPYLPEGTEYPVNKKRNPLRLLAQINFLEVPFIEGMPKEGVLQFYIDAEDDLMGMNLEDLCDQTGFKILYHPSIERDLPRPIGRQKEWNDDEFFPVEDEMCLSFQQDIEPVSSEDFRNEELLGEMKEELLDYDEEELDLWELYYEAFSGEGHKIGGYPYFTQEDPRHNNQYEQHDVLLLQVDTDENGIMWGDSGVGNFFIKKEDLHNLNFENVLYYWDCH